MSLKIEMCQNGFILTEEDEREDSLIVDKTVYECDPNDLQGAVRMLDDILLWGGLFGSKHDKKRIIVEVRDQGEDEDEKEEVECP